MSDKDDQEILELAAKREGSSFLNKCEEHKLTFEGVIGPWFVHRCDICKIPVWSNRVEGVVR
tara:strand:+ start:134 stop:319 length:186 start_codon:yes stop_codon:yes gene_type:complete